MRITTTPENKIESGNVFKIKCQISLSNCGWIYGAYTLV